MHLPFAHLSSVTQGLRVPEVQYLQGVCPEVAFLGPLAQQDPSIAFTSALPTILAPYPQGKKIMEKQN